ncbi:MAG: hypothetical protein IPG91_10235 [Ideonella sp.]|nr:hypothetical protein [Ideonella sp.]
MLLALGAEALGFFAPDLLPWRVATMALSVGCHRTRGAGHLRASPHAPAPLDINALLTVAVGGTFVISQWPEAAMVMALYAIAGTPVEARAVDRARNAIRSCWRWHPKTPKVRQLGR